MPDTPIEKLTIEINTESQKANDKIDELCAKIDNLSKSVGKIETGNFSKISKGIGEITSSLKGIEKVNTDSFKNIASSINTLSKVNADSLNSVSGSLKTLKSGLNEISGISFNTDGLDKVAESVRVFGYKTNTAGTANLSVLKTDLLDFANGLNSISSINFDMTGLQNLTSNISKLGGKTATQAVQNLQPLKEEILSFVNGLNGIGSLNFDISGITTIVTDISRLGGKSVTTAISNIPLLSTALNDMMTTLSNAPAVSQNIIQMTNALANLSAQGSKVGSASNSIVKGLNRASSSATNAKKSFKGLASAFGTFYANCFLVIRGLKSLWSSIESTGDYLEAYNYFDVALTKVGNDWASQYEQYGYESAEAYANSFSTRLSEKLSGLSGVKLEISADGETGILTESNMKNLGLNIQEVTQYASQLASVTNSVGQTGEVSLATASAFTKLGADMSSLFNTDYSTVMNNLQSGLIGQSRALYKYGIDITNATLQTYAYELGVEKAVSEMTQAEKMQLRMIAILDQSRVSWGDQANTINSLSNSIRQFKNNISEIGQVLGQLFVPIMTKVMSIVNGVTIVVKRLLTSIAGLFGIKLNLGENLKTDDVAEEIGGISDSLDDATTSAENLKKATTTLGIDELNINSPQTDTSSGTTGSVGGGLDLTGDILSAMEEYEKVWQEAYDNMVNEAEAFADRIEKALEPVKKIFEDIKIGDWFAVGQDTSNLVVSIFDFFAKAIDEVDWYGIGTKIGDFLAGVEWTEVLSSVGNLIWEAIKASIELWTGAYDAAPIETAIITGIALLEFTGVGSLIVDKIKEKILEKIGSLTSIFTEGGLFTNIGLVFENLFSGLSLKDSLTAVFGELGTKILGIGTIIAGVVIAVTNFFSMWRDGFSWVKEAIMLVGIALTAVGAVILGAPALVAGVVAGIVAAVATIAVVVHDNWDSICEFTSQLWEKVSGFFSNLWEDIVNIFTPVANWFSENVIDPVVSFFQGLWTRVKQIFEGLWIIIQAVWIVVSTWFNDNVITPVINFFAPIVEKIGGFFTDLWDGIKKVWEKVSNWFSENIITPVSSAFETACEKIGGFFTDLWSGIKKGVSGTMNAVISGIESAINFMVGGVNKIIQGFNKVVSWAADVVGTSWGGIELVPTVSLGRIDVSGYETGGFPKSYSMFMAGENGRTELLGTVGGRTAVASGTEITGISNAVYSTSEEELRELREMNSLLRQLLEKDTSVNIGDKEIYKASVRGSKAYGRLLIT